MQPQDTPHPCYKDRERDNQAIKAEQQKKFVDLSKKPQLSSYIGIPNNLAPPDILAARNQPP